MAMVNIPIKWTDPEHPENTYMLRTKDLPVAACFECDQLGLKVTLIPSEEKDTPQGPANIDGTGLTLKFLAGILEVTNKKVLELVMGSPAYKNGQIRIHRQDPTGFWRMAGMVTTHKVEVVLEADASHPAFGEVDLTKITTPKQPPAPVQKAV